MLLAVWSSVNPSPTWEFGGSSDFFCSFTNTTVSLINPETVFVLGIGVVWTEFFCKKFFESNCCKIYPQWNLMHCLCPKHPVSNLTKVCCCLKKFENKIYWSYTWFFFFQHICLEKSNARNAKQNIAHSWKGYATNLKHKYKLHLNQYFGTFHRLKHMLAFGV